MGVSYAQASLDELLILPMTNELPNCHVEVVEDTTLLFFVQRCDELIG